MRRPPRWCVNSSPAGRPILEVAGSDEQLIQVIDPGRRGGRVKPERRRRSRSGAIGARASPRR